jgi:GTP-binding protein
MKFIDIANIYIKAGDGGNGHISFRKEKFVPLGGPDGGNGGKGGDVIFQVDTHLNTLLDFQYKREFVADNGDNGGKSRRTGKNGKNLIIRVPSGTVVKNADDDSILADLDDDNTSFVAAKGGNGGFGNSEFATATNQAPRFANPGLPGTEYNISLELKLIADVGFVGFPNAGKSTLISSISAAKPKIADYPFTTLVPNLGIVKLDMEKSFTVADIPGLIEGAADGKGLGHQFLRHIERTKVLVFLIDSLNMNYKEEYEILLNELRNFNEDIIYKKKIITFSKVDSITDEIRNELKNTKLDDAPHLLISSVSHENIDELKWLMWKNINA